MNLNAQLESLLPMLVQAEQADPKTLTPLDTAMATQVRDALNMLITAKLKQLQPGVVYS